MRNTDVHSVPRTGTGRTNGFRPRTSCLLSSLANTWLIIDEEPR